MQTPYQIDPKEYNEQKSETLADYENNLPTLILNTPSSRSSKRVKLFNPAEKRDDDPTTDSDKTLLHRRAALVKKSAL